MPRQTRSKTVSSNKGNKIDTQKETVDPTMAVEEETAYEWLYCKVQENKKKRKSTTVSNKKEKTGTKILKRSTKSGETSNMKMVSAHFHEDDNYVEMEVESQIQREEFPTPSEEEDNQELSDTEDGEIVKQMSQNNNATVAGSNVARAEGSCSVSPKRQNKQVPSYLDEPPSTSTGIRDGMLSQTNEDLAYKVSVMQEFMIKKGIVTNEELQQLLLTNEEEAPIESNKERTKTPVKKGIEQNATGKRKSNCHKDLGSIASSSDITIYKRAVQQIAPEIEVQIEKYIQEVRASGTEAGHKVSSSSDELMDTCDEVDLANNIDLIAANVGPSEVVAPEQKAEEMICEAECNKAKMFTVPGKQGKFNTSDILAMDVDYQMIDAHVDDTL